jgi:hypothetical protein
VSEFRAHWSFDPDSNGIVQILREMPFYEIRCDMRISEVARFDVSKCAIMAQQRASGILPKDLSAARHISSRLSFDL